MAEKYFPFNAVDVEGQPDRVYGAEDFAEFFAAFVGNGVYAKPSTNLQVLSLNNNMVLMVNPGRAMINGYGYILTESMPVQINTANANYNRKDIIVVALDLVERNILVKYKPGVASANPTEPELVRSSDVHELKLASILVRSGVQGITQSDITDTRLNSDVCGIVTNVVQSVDTTMLFNQYMDFWEQKQAQWNEAGEQQQQAWREQMESQASEHSAQQQRIEDWYNSVKANIALLQRFDFDNIADMAGAKRVTASLENGSVVETIVLSSNSRKIADRTSEFLSDGNIKQTTRVYIEDGITVGKTFTVVTEFLENGNIEEVIS